MPETASNLQSTQANTDEDSLQSEDSSFAGLRERVQLYRQINSQQADELVQLQQHCTPCLCSTASHEAAHLLKKQEQSIQELNNKLTALDSQIAAVNAAMVSDEQEHQTEMVQLKAREAELWTAKKPWASKIDPIEAAITYGIAHSLESWHP